MSVAIGTNPIAWTNDDMPELGGETPLEVCLAEARQAGFAGMELGGKFPREAKVLRPILEKHALTLISGWYSAELARRTVGEEIHAVASHLKLLTEMECKIMVFAETTGTVQNRRVPLSERPRLKDDQWKEYGDRLTAVGEHLKSHGVHLAFHHHMGTIVETEEEVDRLLENTGEAVGLLLDTGHAAYADADPVRMIRRWGHRIKHVHCKDVRSDRLTKAKAQDNNFMAAVVDGVFTVPGDGDIDFRAVLAALKEADYRGDWLVVEAEQDPAKAHPLTYAVEGYRHISALVREMAM